MKRQTIHTLPFFRKLKCLAFSRIMTTLFASALLFAACGSDSTSLDELEPLPPYALSISISELNYKAATPENNTLAVNTSMSWEATSSDPEMEFSPSEGVGDAIISITALPAGKVHTLTVRAREGYAYLSRTVVISRAANDPDPEDPDNPDTPSQDYRWPELPTTPADMTNKKIYTHWTTTVTTEQHVRNFTYCYDTYRHCPLWIAFPQHACYTEGSDRSDKWNPDPQMTNTQQAIMYPLEADNNYALSLYSEALDYQWQRGHMLASSYRPGKDKEINLQTFYASNIAPQLQGSTAFQSAWSAIERKVLDSYVCADTLYCVTGTYFENDNTTARDASRWNNSVRYYVPGYSKTCIVPTHYYKLLLRTRSGASGKAIQDCKPSELKAVAIWFEPVKEINGATSVVPDASYLRSVKWVEEKTGFTFYPDVDASVKESYTAADWGM